MVREFCRACKSLKLSRPKPCAKLANPSFMCAATATKVSFVDKVLLWWLERHFRAHTWGLPSAFAFTVKLKMIPVQLVIHNAPMKFILSIHIVYKQMCEREIHTYTFHCECLLTNGFLPHPKLCLECAYKCECVSTPVYVACA